MAAPQTGWSPKKGSNYLQFFLAASLDTRFNLKVFKMSPSDICVTCYEPLLLEIESDSETDEESSSQSLAPTAVPDDVEFPCSCHFHW